MTRLIDRGIERGEFKPTPLRDYPQLLFAPVLTAIIWRALFERHYHLDTNGLLAHQYRFAGRGDQSASSRTVAKETVDEASHRLPRLCRDRRRCRIAADDLPGQQGDDISRLHGGRLGSGRLRAGRPRRRRSRSRKATASRQGDPIFTLESSEQDAVGRRGASRASQEAEARLADVKAEMQRPDEINVLEAALNEAKAMLRCEPTISTAPDAVRQGLDDKGRSSTTRSPSMTATRPRSPRPRSASPRPSCPAAPT